MMIMLTQTQIQDQIKRLAETINEFHTGQDTVVLCNLTGSFYFTADLTRELTFEMILEPIEVKSYSGEFEKRDPEWILKPQSDLSHKTVYIVDDIIETGESIKFIISYIRDHYDDVDIKVISLIRRKESTVNFDVDQFNGFEVEADKWLVGYGMDDCNGYNRNLPYISC